jgi:serine/threonine-protein kinase
LKKTVVVGNSSDAEAVAATLPSAGTTLAPGPVAAVGGVDLAPGTLIGDSFSIVRPLGKGAMGIVVLAHDTKLDRQVAIKFVRPDLGAGFRRRFIAEAQAMARVNHPNVVHIHAFGQHGEVPYFVMEHIEGPTLERWLKTKASLPDIDVAVRILEEICHGVSAIHAAETAHRDIKPSNLLLDSALHVRIADLGLAVLSHDSNSKEIVGTPGYMAPEIAYPEGHDPALLPRADVYSLGCVAYELLTGREPFETKSNLEMMLFHATKPVAPPSTLRVGLSPAFDDAILRALAKDAKDRTPSAEAFRIALVAARDGLREPDRILVAEDDADFREALEIALTREFPHADIECVPDGRAALEAFERKTPSVAILDLAMPHLDGLELTGLLRARESSATMPIIVLTASGGPEEWKRLSAMGADRFLVKPVNLHDVVAMVRRALQERNLG